MAPPASDTRSWTRNHHGGEAFLCTTDPRYVQLNALNAALGSDMCWWAKALPEADLPKMVDHSLCLGLYLVDDLTATSSTEAAVPSHHPMVGFARLITDYVTFAYLTDVYVLREHQGKGLGRWMMECLNEVLTSWPGLRRTMLAVSDPNAVKLYEKTLGMEVVQPGKLSFMQALGPAAPARRL